MNIEGLSLDQFRVLLAVVETGRFTAAARRLNRAQSAVSYAIATLEQQLGVELFDRSGYRPALSAAGSALIGEVREVVARADRVRTRARAIAAGLEPEVALVTDVMYPTVRLGALLGEFQSTFPTVSVRLHVEALGGVTQLVLDGTCALGIVVTLPNLPDGLTGQALAPVTLVPVAAPGHPLSRLPSPIAASALHDQTQIVLSDRSRLTEGRNFNVFSARTWRVADLGAKHALLRAGLGWGTMPRHMVARDLEAGALVELRLEAIPESGDALSIHVVHRADRALGPAARWVFDRLRRDGTESALEPSPGLAAPAVP